MLYNMSQPLVFHTHIYSLVAIEGASCSLGVIIIHTNTHTDPSVDSSSATRIKTIALSLLFSTRPSLSQSTDTDSVNQGPRPNLLPKFAISAESEGDETSGLGDPSQTSFAIGELPQDEHDATTPGSTHSGATLSGMKFKLRNTELYN